MISFFLNRRVLTTLISVFVIAVGMYQFVTVRREAFPEFTFDMITVTTLYPGASPEEVERLVTLPLEETIRGVDNIRKAESYSVEGRSLVMIWLEEGLSSSKVSRAVSDVQQAVARVDDLPELAKAPIVTEMTSDRPLISVAVAGADDDTRDRYADYLKDILEDIDGVSKVERQGHRARQIWVEVEPERLSRYRLTMGEIADALRAENVDLSAGTVVAGRQEFLVRTLGGFDTATDVAAVIVRGNDERSYVRVRDIARVRETFADDRVIVKANGRPAINLQVRKKKMGDTIKLADAVKALVAREAPAAAAKGVELVVSDDFSYFIRQRLSVMKNNMIQGGVLILAALFIFLDWRLALVAAMGVPISFAAAMIAAVPMGITINLMSLLAFIIVLGMLDDDSVTVAENIYRHLEMGKPPMQAAMEGSREVLLPVIGSVCSTGAAFIPFALVDGIMGKFLLMIPIIVIACFIASVFEAFCILPAHVLDLMPFGRPVEGKAESHWFVRVRDRYERLLRWCVRHRYKFTGIAVLVLAGTIVVAGLRLKVIMFPEGMIDQFFVEIEMEPGASLEESGRALEVVEKALLTIPAAEREAVIGAVGQTGYEETLRQGTHYAQAHVFLVPQQHRERKTDDIIAELRPAFDAIPGARITIDKLRPGPPVGKAVLVRVRGDDPVKLQQIADEIKAHLTSTPGVRDVRDNFEGGKQELQVRVLGKEAAYAGVTTAEIARHVLMAFDGGEATTIRRSDEEVAVKVRLSTGVRSAEALQNLYVQNRRGQTVSLAPLVRADLRRGPPFIEHYDYKRAIAVTASVDNRQATSYSANAAVRKAFADIPARHPGYDVVFGGEEEETQKSMRSLGRGFVVAVLLDLVILAGLFNSFVQPFIILLTIPIGIVGVAWALMLHNEPASFMAMLGTVAMTGVVINNAIVLIDFINTERARGVPITEAVIAAGRTRLRPIFASSITTLLGLFPSAYGIGGLEPFVAPMCLALAWGLTLAMPMTLFVIPMAVLITEDARALLGRLNPFHRRKKEL